MISIRPGRAPRAARIRRLVAAGASPLVLAAGLQTALAFHDSTADDSVAALGTTVGHLLVSEVMTGGASASDEFIEIYNPAPEPMPLEGLEVVYVTASGGTVTRKATWPAGSTPLATGAHLLISNSAGIFVSIGDQTYSGGLAATGGSVAIRIIGAATAIDAAGWGNATSAWLEGTPVPDVAAGHSIERLPGGAAGSGQDSDQNSADFADRASPDPQNAASSPIPVATPSATPTPAGSPIATPTVGATSSEAPSTTAAPTGSTTATPTATATPTLPVTASPTPTVTAVATPTPTLPLMTPTPPAVMTIAAARVSADGTMVTIEGVALTDSAFTDGGGYVADASAGIAVLLSGGAFQRGASVRITGTVDDRFSQRTLRADASGIELLGGGIEPSEQELATGAIGEDDEGKLVAVSGTLTSGPTQLTSTVAFDLDDGSGPIRVLVGTASGIDLGAWMRGSQLHLRGVIGQRDSSGTGTAGYRLQPRDAADVLSIAAQTPSPTPSATASQTPSPFPSPSANPTAISIAAARARPTNSRLTVRGVVTLPSSLVDQGTAAIQDATGAIVLRLSDEAGTLRIGELVEVDGTRSTKSGMETLRVVAAPRRLGTQALPDPRQRPTGALGENDEAVLVSVHGAVTTTPRRTSAENVYFDVDDGSGAIRVFVAPGAAADTEHLLSGTQVAIVGVLGQETTGSLPERGYRLWPRRAQDVRIVSQPTGVSGGTGTATGTGNGPDTPSGSSGGSGTGAVAQGNGTDPAGHAGSLPQQARPRLLLAASSSAAPTLAVAETAQREEAGPAQSPEPLSAGLLLLGGLLLIGSGVAAGDPGLPARVRRWVSSRFGHRSEHDAPDEDEAGDEQATIGLPRLVPLPVVDGVDAVSPRAPRSIHEERERILPPT